MLMTRQTLRLGSPAHGGFCVSRLDNGKVIMVRGGIPGERVTVEITSQRSKVAYGRVVEVIEASPNRVAHLWVEGEAKDLGGVELGHVSYQAGLEWKREVVAQALRRNGSEALRQDIDAIAPQWRVESVGDDPGRTRATFTVTEDGKLGMSSNATHILQPVQSMPLMVPALADLDLFSLNLGLPAGTRVKFVAPSAAAPVIYTAGRTLALSGEATTSQVRETVRTPADSFTYRIDAGSFWQTDFRAPATLVQALLEALGSLSGFEVLELYSGSGLFSLFLAKAVGDSGSLTTVEADKIAVKSAQYNLRKHGFSAQTCVCSVDGKTLGELALNAPYSKRRPRGGRGNHSLRSLSFGSSDAAGTVVVADPPRSGLGKDTALALCALGADAVFLFSCDPVSGARDLEVLRRGGYHPTRFRVFDLFPYTHHVETVALLSKVKP